MSRDRFYQRPNVSLLQVFIVKDKRDTPPKVLDENKTVDDEDPYRGFENCKQSLLVGRTYHNWNYDFAFFTVFNLRSVCVIV